MRLARDEIDLLDAFDDLLRLVQEEHHQHPDWPAPDRSYWAAIRLSLILM